MSEGPTGGKTNGARVQLTAVRLEDVEAVHRWKNDEALQLSSSDTFTPESLEQTRTRVERWMASDPNDIVHFAIRLREARAMVGFYHLAQIDRHHECCKIGIVLGERALWGRGLGSETLSLLVAAAFEQGLTRVAAEVYASNARSLRMLERAGFEREGVRRASVRRAAAWEDEILLAIVAPSRC